MTKQTEILVKVDFKNLADMMLEYLISISNISRLHNGVFVWHAASWWWSLRAYAVKLHSSNASSRAYRQNHCNYNIMHVTTSDDLKPSDFCG